MSSSQGQQSAAQNGGAEGGAEEEASLESVAVQGLRSVRALRAGLNAALTPLTESKRPSPASTDASPPKRPRTEQSKEKEDEAGTVAALKQGLATLTRGYEELDRLASRYLRKSWPPLLSTTQALFLTESAVSADGGARRENYAAVTEDVQAWMGKNAAFASYAGNFLRQSGKTPRRAAPLSRLDSLVEMVKRLEDTLNTGAGGTAVRLEVLEASRVHAKLVARLLYPPAEARTPPSLLFQVAVLFKASSLDWATALGPDEAFVDAEGRADFGKESRHLLFRRLSAELKAFVLTYAGNTSGWSYARILYQFLIRLVRLRNMFQESCKACGKVMKDYLPPYVLDMKYMTHYYHDSCRLAQP